MLTHIFLWTIPYNKLMQKGCLLQVFFSPVRMNTIFLQQDLVYVHPNFPCQRYENEDWISVCFLVENMREGKREEALPESPMGH